MADKTEQAKSRVFLVDDHALVRRHLTALLGREADLEVCGEAGDLTSALALVRQQLPELVILDISLKRSNGLQLLESFKGLEPAPRVLVLSMHDEAVYVERALAAGARGYVTKEEASIDILSAIRTVLAGGLHLSARMAARLNEKTSVEPKHSAASTDKLTA